ncbi:acyl-CoA thioesterase [uncultured Roseovarius sp.]|uniref:acyl-CoA thioesterase n=1 Tax=uncultured Roseovarius sp. TaxID=293344 RepID=UPI00262D13CC|nr:acyl-CoA thioesterase [uncultured Roseovarius sp.]
MIKATADRLSSARDRSKHGRQQEEGILVIRTIAMPADTNPAGDVFGGWLMSQMDLAAGNMAARASQGRGATVAVEAMQFLHPVKVGDEVTIYASLRNIGRTSIRVHVDVWSRSRFEKGSQKVTDADFVFVALDELGQPRELPEG